MRILAIDTSNEPLALAVWEDHQLLGQYQTAKNKNHSVTLMPAIDFLVKNLGLVPQDFDRFVVAQGPGSYTGLRIGVTTGKTLADTLKKELVGISSLATLAMNGQGAEYIVPLFDARRQNVYSGLYQPTATGVTNLLPDQHVPLTEWLPQIAAVTSEPLFLGTAAQTFAPIIKEVLPKARFSAEPLQDLPNGFMLAELGSFAEPTDIASFLPNYLKRVEAEEKWLATHHEDTTNYVEKI